MRIKLDKSQDAPLYNRLSALAMYNPLRLHMPGHKGKSIFRAFGEIFAIDFTETYGTGNLYEEEGPIRDAEKLAARYYGAADCHFLTGGSTQGIHAMLSAAVDVGGKVVLDRSCHKSVLSACVLFDLEPVFVYPETAEPFGVGSRIDLEALEAVFRAHPDAKAFLTVSPNYYGILQDIAAIAVLCRKYDKKLLVDGAHGAHLSCFGMPGMTAQGADAAVLSAHKTLPSMGQGAYLLLGEGMDGRAAREAEALTGTSSPSYPIMASLDLARLWLENDGQHKFIQTGERTALLKRWMNKKTVFRTLMQEDGVSLDPCRLTVYCGESGYSGKHIAEMLYRQFNIACEMADRRCFVCIMTGADSRADFLKLRYALGQISSQCEGKEPERFEKCEMPQAARAVSVREAFFAKKKSVKLELAEGQVCARPITPYPPGIPLLWPGEKITAQHIEFLQNRCYTEHERIDIID